MAPEANTERYRRLIEEGFSRGNLGSLDAMVAPDFEEHESLPPGLPAGWDGVKAFVTSVRSAFPDMTWTIEDMTSDGDKVWARVTVRGTNTGPFMGNAPTGRAVEFEIIDICRFADGKMVEHWGVSDNLSMMQQLEAGGAPG